MALSWEAKFLPDANQAQPGSSLLKEAGLFFDLRRRKRDEVIWTHRQECLLVSDENLERRDELSHGHAGIVLPLLVILKVIQEDDEIIILALEVDLNLSSFAFSHLAVLCRGSRFGSLV